MKKVSYIDLPDHARIFLIGNAIKNVIHYEIPQSKAVSIVVHDFCRAVETAKETWEKENAL